jgi:hypothetical protein
MISRSYWLLLGALPCCGGNVTVPSKPAARAAYSAVVVGMPVPLSATWEGTCDNSGIEAAFGVRWGAGPTNHEHSCNQVDFDATVTCDDNACTWTRVNGNELSVIPTKPGLLKAHVRFAAHDGRPERTLDLEPIQVLVPTTAKVTRCELRDNVARVDVAVFAAGISLDHQSSVRIKNGAKCMPENHAFRCPLTDTKAELEVFSPDYTVLAAADCVVVFPAPDGVLQTGSRYDFVLRRPYTSCTDDLMKKTRHDFATFGWKEAATPDGMTLVESRNGIRADITLGETSDGDCTWSLKTESHAIVGTHEIAD